MVKKSLARLIGVFVILLCTGSVAQAASVTFTWDPPTDSTVAGYIVYWGTQSGKYTQSLDVGKVNVATVTTTGHRPALLFHGARLQRGASVQPGPSTEAAAWLGTVWRTPSLLSMGDFDGDGSADPMVYRSSNGQWFASGSRAGLLSCVGLAGAR